VLINSAFSFYLNSLYKFTAQNFYVFHIGTVFLFNSYIYIYLIFINLVLRQAKGMPGNKLLLLSFSFFEHSSHFGLKNFQKILIAFVC
jgi:hypothetical protein